METSEYTFQLAQRRDKASIFEFIHTHWDLQQPFVDQPDFFAYYFEGEGDRLRFALAEAGGRLVALAGYIPASRATLPDVWVSFWMADPASKGAGLELMAALPALVGCRTLACNNIRPETQAFYRFLGFETGRMGHFYRLADKERYTVAQVGRRDVPPAGGDGTLVPLKSAEVLAGSGFVPPADANPYKDLWYLTRRYFSYPRQSYEVYGGVLPGGGAPAVLFAVRTIPAGGTAVLRVADFVGDAALLPRFGAALDGLLREKGAEYADFYCAGIPPAVMRQAGFAEREEGDEENILPNYLEPPLLQNTEYYYFTSRPAGFVMCKADGDQDRPRTDR